MTVTTSKTVDITIVELSNLFNPSAAVRDDETGFLNNLSRYLEECIIC